jgi:DNA-binding MarR family transcriptional regulator
MELQTCAEQELVLVIADSWDRLRARLEGGLSHLKGISFAEYRLLRSIAESPGGRASRVDLADRVGLSPSGVTRALRPLEKLGFVESERAPRDARLTLAVLTPAGEELVSDSSSIVDDIAASLIEQAPNVAGARDTLIAMLTELAA